MEYAWNLSQSPNGARLDNTGETGASLSCPVAGSCTVLLRVKDSEGAFVNETLNITFYGRNPIAVLSANRTSARPGNDFGFSAAGSSDADNDSLQYMFDFGDGNTTGWGNSPAAVHKYQVPGNYSANLIVRDPEGNTSRPAIMNLTVLPFNVPPRATFTVVQGNLTTPFRFSSTSADPDGTISTALWDFGDGTGGTGLSVTHQYLSGGDFNVTLTVTDNENASSMCATLIRINRAPAIHTFAPVRDLTIKVNEALNFSVIATDPDGDTLRIIWRINGVVEQNGTGALFHQVFHIKGTYIITVSIDDNRGGTASMNWNLTVTPAPSGIDIAVNNASILPWFVIIVIAVIATTLLISKRRRIPK